ncbi:MAG: DUF1269 domain-containing protein [Thermoleophilia bacterium]|nr:DUF1269 domain-containing protein [Thermoleophilia bacterium]
MSELIVIGYDEKATAEQAAEAIGRLSKDYLLKLEQAAVVYREEDGKLKSEVPKGLVAAGTLGGMFWGTLFGLIFLVPVAGMAIGAGMGALTGKLTDLGVKKEFQSRVGDLLQPGKAALFLVVDDVTVDKVLPEMQKFGGEVLRTSLSVDDEHALAEALEKHPS